MTLEQTHGNDRLVRLQITLASEVLTSPATADALVALLEKAKEGGFKDLDTNTLGTLADKVAPFAKTSILSALTLGEESTSYNDNREGFGPHRAINFTVTLSREVKLDDALNELLGCKDAAVLMGDWDNRINFSKGLSGEFEAILFLDSNNKARSQEHAPPRAKTTQAADFEGAELVFADDAKATLICALLVNKAKSVGLDLCQKPEDWDRSATSRLNSEELDLLTKLRVGVLRTSSGTLDVCGGDGRLHASRFNDHVYSNRWAFGARSSAKLKN